MDVVFFLDQLSIRKRENFIRIIYFVVFVKLWEENFGNYFLYDVE